MSSPWSRLHVSWLSDTNDTLITNDGITVKTFRFNPDFADNTICSAWAKHFRNHYCLDDEIDLLRDGTGLSRSEFLQRMMFPGDSAPGPSIKAGDFAEIVLADYMEFLLNFNVPRTRYGSKTVRNESTKGSDIIGYRVSSPTPTPGDELLVFEVKAHFTGNKPSTKLQEAVNHSGKDPTRLGESLNAIKRRLIEKSQMIEAAQIARFQNPIDKPYSEKFGAAAFMTSECFDESQIKSTITTAHPARERLMLVVVSANDCMDMVNRLYQMAADEA